MRLRLGGQSPRQRLRTTEWIDLWTARLYGRFTGTPWILRVFLCVVFPLPIAYCRWRRYPFACTLAYPIVLTIVHIDGTLSHPSTVFEILCNNIVFVKRFVVI